MLAANHSLARFRLAVANPANLENSLVQGLVACWNHSYERMAARFNPQAPTEVQLEVVAGLAAAGLTDGARIQISADWIRENPLDLDVMTHEQFHVVQNYGPGAQPGWAVEGLADYARWKYGRTNSVWSLPKYQPGQHWSQGYGVTANFFRWLEEERRSAFPQELDQTLRQRSYSAAFWTSRFHQELADLWRDFALDQQPGQNL